MLSTQTDLTHRLEASELPNPTALNLTRTGDSAHCHMSTSHLLPSHCNKLDTNIAIIEQRNNYAHPLTMRIQTTSDLSIPDGSMHGDPFRAWPVICSKKREMHCDSNGIDEFDSLKDVSEKNSSASVKYPGMLMKVPSSNCITSTEYATMLDSRAVHADNTRSTIQDSPKARTPNKFNINTLPQHTYDSKEAPGVLHSFSSSPSQTDNIDNEYRFKSDHFQISINENKSFVTDLHPLTVFPESCVGLEDAHSFDISSETRRAMDSSESTPPSSENLLTNPTTSSASTDKASPSYSPPANDSLAEHEKPIWNAEFGMNAGETTYTMSPLQPSSEYTVDTSRKNFPETQQSPCLYSDYDRIEKGCSVSMTCSEALSSDESDEGMSMARFEHMTNSVQPDQTGLFICHLCEFRGRSKLEFQEHLRSHYDYKCQKCDYTSRTEGRLKRHVKDFHSEVRPDNFSGKTMKPVRLKLQRCKQCSFTTETKDDFWRHLRVHIKDEKRLECKLCCFVTEYKHHLEYHMRNHMGTKPYRCQKCNYECVNKSMLNSHMKSHSNVYPYRCANCHYATKYCHSLKLHLMKHEHKPAVVLNADGSVPSYDNTNELLNLRRGSSIRQSICRSNQPLSMNNDSAVNSLTPDGSMLSSNNADSQLFTSPSALMQTPLGPRLTNNHATINGLPDIFRFDYLSQQLQDASQSNLPGAALLDSYPMLPFPLFPQLPPITNLMLPNPSFDNYDLTPGVGVNANIPSINYQRSTSAMDLVSTVTNPSSSDNNNNHETKPIMKERNLNDSSLNTHPFSMHVHPATAMAAFMIAVQQAGMCTPTNLTPNATSLLPSTEAQENHSNNLHSTPSTVKSDLGMVNCILPNVTTSSNFDNSAKNLSISMASTETFLIQQNPIPLLSTTRHCSQTDSNEVRVINQNSRISDKPQNQSENDVLDLTVKLDTTAAGTATKVLGKIPDLITNSKASDRSEDRVWTDDNSASEVKIGVGCNDQVQIPDYIYECRFCEICFRRRDLFAIHMGFHSHTNPYHCNRCGHQSRDSVDFFIHLSEMPHHN